MAIPEFIQREFKGMQLKSGLCFYIGIPVFAGLLLGWNRVFVGAEVARGVAIAFWIGLTLLEWLAAIIGSQVAFSLLRPWRPPAWIVWCGGAALAACIFFYPISRYLEFGSTLGGTTGLATHLPAHLRAETIPQLLTMVAGDVFPGLALWVAANYFFAGFLGIPRHRYPANAVDLAAGSIPDSQLAGAQTDNSRATPHNTSGPIFMRNVTAEKRGTLLALEAQDHYVRVITDCGEDLIHYRFSDAVEDARHVRGLRVHRSYWIANVAIARLERDRHRYRLRLSNGLCVPVSRSYLRDVRAMLSEDRGADP